MKQYFLKISGFAALVLLLHVNGFAQDESVIKEKPGKMGDRDEIIIKRKGDKDSKVVIEIKDGQVFINGKPADDFDDDNIIIKRKRNGDEDLFALAPRSPFRGGVWSYSGDVDSKTAFLGVSSEKDEKEGVEIQEVTKGSGAEKAGLKKGDIITKIDDVKIDDPEELTETIRKHKPEDKIVVTFKRDGKEQKATAVLGKFKWEGSRGYNYNFKMPEINNDLNWVNPPRGPRAYVWSDGGPKIGIKAQDTEDGKGVKVLDVDDESPASKAGLKEGDVITQFDGKDVNGANQLAELARVAKTKPSVKIKLNRGGKVQELNVKIPKKLKTADL
jgi:serine protease Do